MSDEPQIDALTQRFKALGAPNPRSWAESQVQEGLPQLARYLFLRQAWARIVSETDSSWIESWVAAAERQPEAPYAGGGLALKRLRALGATSEDLTDLVRAFQAELLFSICYLLDDPSIEDPDEQEMAWALVQLTPDGEVIQPISGLYESVLSTDPTGREMRPRP